MCRMIAAIGEVNGAVLAEAAIGMSHGTAAQHEYAVCGIQHYDGWGAVYLEDGAKELTCVRSERSMPDDPRARRLHPVRARVMVVHVRHASVPANKGVAFTHPFAGRIGEAPGYFFHNGFAPDVYQLLGRAASHWDTRELFDWLSAGFARDQDESLLRQRLEQLPPSTTSANFLLAQRDRLMVCNWFAEDSRTPNYYTLFQYQDSRTRIIASEPVPRIAPRAAWLPIANRSLFTIVF